MTQTIKYNDKEYKLPFAVGLSDEPTATETIANRFSGEEVELPQFATAVYDTITGAEVLEDWTTVQKGLDWFRKHGTTRLVVPRFKLLDASSLVLVAKIFFYSFLHSFLHSLMIEVPSLSRNSLNTLMLIH